MENLIEKHYTVVPIGESTSALLFCSESGDVEIYIGNETDIEMEASGLASTSYTKDENLLSKLRKKDKLALPLIEQGTKHYDIEDVIQGQKTVACVIRSVHESHGKLIPNTITFAIEPSLIDSEPLYPKALNWIKSRSDAFAKILESEGMKQNSDFILSSFIHALSNDNRLNRFIDADRGVQTVTENMLA